jgi:hypothetical protein
MKARTDGSADIQQRAICSRISLSFSVLMLGMPIQSPLRYKEKIIFVPNLPSGLGLW